MALIGSLATLRAQTAGLAGFAGAFPYLDEVLRPRSVAHRRLQGLAAGGSNRVELAAGMFAIEQAYVTKARPEGFFESHRKFIDIQVVVEGEEVMELADISRLTVRESYNPERDLIVYGDFTAASVLRFGAGEAAIFFPVDGHMPGLRAGSTGVPVRKTVVKVPVPA